MAIERKDLQYRFPDTNLGLSAVRLWEHAEWGQCNVFDCPVLEAADWIRGAARFIDIVQWRGDKSYSLTGFTLANSQASAVLNAIRKTESEYKVLANARKIVRRMTERTATRNTLDEFLPAPTSAWPLGVPFLYSTLERKLEALGKTKASPEQWLGTIRNFQKNGLRKDELERSGLEVRLLELGQQKIKLDVGQVLAMCQFNEIVISVIPVLHMADQQLRFNEPPEKLQKPLKTTPRAQKGQTRNLDEYDRVLGYRIEKIEHATLWGTDTHWQSVSFDGKPIADENTFVLCQSPEDAQFLAEEHAKRHFPKRHTLGKWSRWAWTGGKDYREWLITLPHYRGSYFSSHFNIRNILAHVRCDTRSGEDGEKILMLQEVQSDWGQQARRAIASGTLTESDDLCPPFLKEWATLALKLILLHAATNNYAGVAWTKGVHQVIRFKGLGAAGLRELYDRTLPKEANRILKPFNVTCEQLGVFVPSNFKIERSEDGYEIFNIKGEHLATTANFEDAIRYFPDGAHELLHEVHGIKLTASSREQILREGFAAFG